MCDVVTDLPFKIHQQSIVILKDLPAFQCASCQEYLLADQVLARVDQLLERVESGIELEIVKCGVTSRRPP